MSNEEIVNKEISVRLRHVIRQKGLSGAKLARLIGVTRQSVSSWIRGESMPRKEHLMAIANHLGVRYWWLLTGEGPSGLEDEEQAIIDTSKNKRAIFSEWLERRMRELGLTDADLARKIGVSRQMIANYRKGAVPRGDKLTALAEALQVPQEKLLRLIEGREQDIFEELEPGTESEARVDIPLVVPRAGAGPPEEVFSEGVERFLCYSVPFLRAELGYVPKRLIAFRVSGDSMEPTLRPGDVVIVALNHIDLVEGSVYLIQIGNGLMIKRLLRMDVNAVEFASDNPRYTNITLQRDEHAQENVRILGRVVKVEKFV